MDVDQQYLVELMDQQDDSGDEEVTEASVATTKISMQTFSGTFNPRTIKLMSWVLGRPLSVLINNDNMHNFI